MIKLRNIIKLDKQKKLYIILISLVVIGILSGIMFRFFISTGDKTLVDDKLDIFFNTIKNGEKLNYLSSLINSISSNLLYTISIWLLGISIIGLPLIIFSLLSKSFIIGFSIVSIIAKYKFIGLLGSFTYIFPHMIISIILSLLLTFYAVCFSIKLFKCLFLRKDIDFKKTMNKYIRVLLFCLVAFLVNSLVEVFISPFIIKLFTYFIKWRSCYEKSCCWYEWGSRLQCSGD